MIQGYDNWKTTPPEEPGTVAHCCYCGSAILSGETVLGDMVGRYYCDETCALERHSIETVTLDTLKG